MATQESGPAARAGGGRLDEAEPPGMGWVLFAGVMLMIAGVMNVIYGIAAIDESQFYIRDVEYVFAELKTWGWILLIIGVVQLFAAFSVWSGTEWGRWVGVASASCNAIAQLLFIPSFPLASLAIFGIDLLIIYGLVAYGGYRRGAV